MIKGVHAMFFSSDAKATRAFIKDKLRLPGTDVGEGWLIFDIAEAEVGIHPLDEKGQPAAGTHDISFYCDDLEAEVAEMKARGVEFTDEIADRGYARCIHFTMPGGVKAELYQPRYKTGRGER